MQYMESLAGCKIQRHVEGKLLKFVYLGRNTRAEVFPGNDSGTKYRAESIFMLSRQIFAEPPGAVLGV